MSKKVLYLIPCHLSENPIEGILSSYNQEVIKRVGHFFVEDVRSARRFISSLKLGLKIENLSFYELTKDTSKATIREQLSQLSDSVEEIGILSEAGCPGLADPGAKLVAIAHAKGWKVAPIPGPSSLFLSLMASGFNGQRFYFYGYLPIKQEEKFRAIKRIEEEVNQKDITHLFIETPFRNQSLLNDLVAVLKPDTKLCIASNLTDKHEFIQTKSIGEWRKALPDIQKIPTIFLIGIQEAH